jgi:hypothetical protein
MRNVIISLVASAAIMSVFYLLDRAQKDEGGNFILFSFLNILLSYLFVLSSVFLVALYIFNHYFSPFLVVFFPTFLIVNLIVIYFISFPVSLTCFKFFMLSTIGILSLIAILAMITLNIVYYQNSNH